MKATFKIIVVAFVVIFFQPIEVLAQDYNIYFDFNIDVMRINDVHKLQEVLNDFKPENQEIKLIGHTDTVGNHKYNLNLSKRRTNAVKDYLVDKGIKSKAIITEYKGRNEPVAHNQFYNRRVEIFIAEKVEETNSFDEFRSSLKPKTQSFKIPSNVGIELEGA